MAAGRVRALLQHLRRMVGPQGSGLTDGHLLERFLSERDEAAFEVLVWRHGPMVLSLCRRLLRHEQDAEDAFQATFLTFVRKARSIGKRQAVAGWLYKVAYRIALEATSLASKRKVRERHAVLEAKAAEQPVDAAVWRDLRAVLDEEIHRLPEKYRTPVVLCYFEGKTYEEAAREIGCPKGTVSIRLMRARELLRPRLARRGLALSGGMLAAVLSENATTAAISRSLVEGTIKAALLFAGGQPIAGLLSGQAVALTEGVLKTMFVTKLKIAAGLFLAVGAAGTGAGVVTYGAMMGEQPSPQAEKALTLQEKEPQEQRVKPAPPETKSKRSADLEDVTRQARLEQARAQLTFDDARSDLHHAEERYRQQERQWTEELIEARLRLIDMETRVKAQEAALGSQIQSGYAKLRSAERDLGKAIEHYRDKNHPAIEQGKSRLRELQKDVDTYREDLIRLRRKSIRAEEELRLLERLQSIQRDRARRKLDAAEERVSRLQELSSRPQAGKEGSSELERKVDRLLREMAELRREIRRPPTEKSQQPPSEHRPDQH